MKALIKTPQSVKIVDSNKPTIQHADGIIVRVAMTGLCRTDVYVAEGLIPAGKDDLVLGHEFSGVIDSVGSDVTHVKAGDRVCVMPFFNIDIDNTRCKYAASEMMGVKHDGSIAEYAYVPAYTVFPLPDQVSFMMGAYMEPICASMAVLKANIKTEQTGMIYGDNRISQLTLRIMKAKGFNDVSCYDCLHDSKELEENSLDFIIETLVTTETFAEMVRAVKPGGTIVLKSRQHKPVEMNVAELVKKDITLEAVNYADFQDCIDLAESGDLHVDDLFGDVYSIEDYEDVFEMSKGREAKKLFLSAANDLVAQDHCE
jgi:L-iditol 2-dehydrogenase